MSSCAAAASAALLWLAAGPQDLPKEPPAPPAAVALEPLFADIVTRAKALKAEASSFKGAVVSDHFRQGVKDLSDLDMKGHVVLAERKTDGDLKCILKGISQDLPVKLKALEAANDPKARHDALEDMFYLLRDNVEVITAPPQPAA